MFDGCDDIMGSDGAPIGPLGFGIETKAKSLFIFVDLPVACEARNIIVEAEIKGKEGFKNKVMEIALEGESRIGPFRTQCRWPLGGGQSDGSTRRSVRVCDTCGGGVGFPISGIEGEIFGEAWVVVFANLCGGIDRDVA